MKMITAILLPVFGSVVLIILFLVLGYAYWVLLILMSIACVLSSYLVLAPYVGRLLALFSKVAPVKFKYELKPQTHVTQQL
jgi:hypothetical protein